MPCGRFFFFFFFLGGGGGACAPFAPPLGPALVISLNRFCDMTIWICVI